jgi:CubicO group peptidase (beta-lactamase class C family)
MNYNLKTLFFSMILLGAFSKLSHADVVDDYIKAKQEKEHIPSVSIAVIKDGKVIKKKSYGLANVEQATKATPSTVYQLASVTKQFTATAIMMLISEGKLSLDDKITSLLPDLPVTWSGVTVRHLLNHTSGIKSYTNTEIFGQTMRKDYTHKEIIDLVTKEPMEFAPGEQWHYNNTGYFLLGMLIEKITGKDYNAFLTERIFQPLGMTQTRVNKLSDIILNRAQGYSWEENTLRNGEYVSPTQPFAAGALVSTVNDMVKWDAGLSTEKLLTKSIQEQMWMPTKLNRGESATYGFGWVVHEMNGHRLIEHNGGIPGFSTQIARFVDDKLTVIVLTNLDNNVALLTQGIAQRYLPALIAPKPPTAKVAPSVLNVYTGYYSLQGRIRTITAQNGRLTMWTQEPGGNPWELVPTSSNTFFLDNVEVDSGRKFRFTFAKNASGQIAKIIGINDSKPIGDALRIGPLAHTLTPEADPKPTLTQGIEATLKVLSNGAKNPDSLTNITPGLRKDFGSSPIPELTGMQGITYIATQNVADQNLVLHGGKVSRVLYYKLRTETKTDNAKANKYVLVYLTEDNLITDEDVVDR